MKPIALNVFFLMSCLILTSGNTGNPASKKITIKEYFYLLPAEAMPSGLGEADERKTAMARKAGQDETVGLITDDPKNGYLALGYQTNWQKASYEFAVWRTTDGVDVIGVNHMFKGVGGVAGTVRFFARKGSEWQDVTAEVFSDFKPETFSPVANAPDNCGGDVPELDLTQGFSCKLPQKGLNITCRFTLYCETATKYSEKTFFKKPVVTFVWKGNKFQIK